MRYLKATTRFIAILTRELAYAGVCLSLLAVLAIALAPQVSGVRFATILSDSMRPSLTRGDMIIAHRVGPEQIEVGDIIMFRPVGDPGVTVAHRVVEIDHSGPVPAFVTRGDANEAADQGVVPASHVLGKVQFRLPLVGYVTHEMREPLVFLLVLAVPGSLIIATEVWNIVRVLKSHRSGHQGVSAGRDP